MIRVLAVLLSLIVSSPAFAAVTFDAASEATPAVSGTSLTWSHTTSNSERLLVCAVHYCSNCSGAVTVTGVTYAGAAMTSAGTRAVSGDSDVVELWYKTAPATSANNVIASWSGTTDWLYGGCASFNGVDQTTSVSGYNTATGNSTGPSVSITSETDHMVVDGLSSGLFTDITAPSVGGGQTERWKEQETTNKPWGAGSTEAGASSVTMSWTLNVSAQWAMAGLNVRPSIPVLTGCRVLQDGTTERALQNGTTGRILQGGGTCDFEGGGGGPVPAGYKRKRYEQVYGMD